MTLLLLLVACHPRLDAEGRQWLRDHAEPFDQEALAVLDPWVSDDGVVLVGEFHGVDESYAVTETVVRWLHDGPGLAVWADEAGPGFTWLVAQAGADPDAQQEIHLLADGTFDASEASRDLDLALSDVMGEITWTGADIEHLWRPGVLALAAQLCDPVASGLPSDLRDIADDLEAGDQVGWPEAEPVVLGLWEDWDDQAGAFCAPDLAFDIASALATRDTAYDAYERDDNRDGDGIREAFITERFTALVGEGPVVGQWGAWHVTRAPGDDFVDPFAERLRDLDVPVLSIALAYTDSRYMEVATGDPLDVHDPVGDRLAPFALGRFTLFVLDGPGSPFADRPLLQEDRDGPPTAELYQAVVLIDGGTASTPL